MEVVMRNFVAASCCAIVGLEILIGVPLAVCMGFLCVGADFSGTYVAETPVAPPIYSSAIYQPGPLPAALPPPVCTVPATPTATFDPYVSLPAAPKVCPAPVASALATLPPYAGSLPASDPAADPPMPAADNPADPKYADRDLPQFVARVSGSEAGAEDCQCASPENELVESLQVSAQLLYQQADRHEVNQEYDLADRLRTLARGLRDESISIRLRVRESEGVSEPPARDPLLPVLPAPPADVPVVPLPQEGPTASVGPPPRG
jgi:hypothetical protein